ncbi:MAG: hypothetical protein MPW15_10980 [Candidatus Manganitrophus sp.]|nr:hypothetical protein [Candidatus Manganitrophus sp.]
MNLQHFLLAGDLGGEMRGDGVGQFRRIVDLVLITETRTSGTVTFLKATTLHINSFDCGRRSGPGRRSRDLSLSASGSVTFSITDL